MITHTGRIIGFVIMAVGVGLFGTFTGFLSKFFIGSASATERTVETQYATDADSGH